MDRGQATRKLANRPLTVPHLSGGANPGPVTFLDVLWVASDEVSFYGLAALLDLVTAVSAYEVLMDVATAERRIQDRSFNVCVFPIESYTTQVGELVGRRGATLILTLPDGRTSEDRERDGRIAEYWLPQQRITLNALEDVFLDISGTLPQRTDSVPSGERALRVLQRVTERERDVLRLLARGQSNQQIAHALGISIHGVKRHVSNLLLKFDCSNRTEVALAASQLELDANRQPDGRQE
jgi:DNA-binding CsgD family transcriptional regulator